MAKSNKNLWVNRFDEINDLGEGGNAKVFRVIEKTTGDEYALKCLYNRSDEKIARFNDEVKIMSENATNIDGIIPIIEHSKEQFWYTMPIAISAIKYIQEEELNYEAIIAGVIQLTETLSKLHEKGIAHRDIKPSNIYCYKNRFCFGDFGLVEFPDNPNDFTRSDKGLGAIFTIAPEMKRDPKHSDGKKADVFSLAKTIWMLLTGDERGFDGTYNFLDESIRLRINPKLKNVHLVELEELLTIATDNEPNNRPSIVDFKDKLKRWKEVLCDFEKVQLSEWRFINNYLFSENIPTSSSWRGRDRIKSVLNIIGSIPAYNHMLFSDGGGLDFSKAELANEEGCLYIYDTTGYCFLVKPKCLYYEGFDENFKWNYFLLDLDENEPIYKNNGIVSYEYLVEDYPAHYVSAQYVQYGVYDYDSGEKFPEGYKCVRRYLGGKFLIVLKNGPYNGITATYDGRHGMCSNIEFRDYLEKVIDVVNRLIKKGANEKAVLKSELFRKNPFIRENAYQHPAISMMEQSGVEEFVSSHYKEWCFKELYNNFGDKNNIRFYITYEGEDSFYSFLDENIDYLCKDGFIKTLKFKQSKEIQYICNREEAKNLIEKCNNLIKRKCEEAKYDITELNRYFSINIERCGKPEHIFSKDEIKELMRNADDRRNNVLVIDENGFPLILQNTDEKFLYPVFHESWNAGNIIVGKYSDLSSLDDDYISSLQGWLMYLQCNEQVSIDYVDENRDENSLLADIKKFY